MSKLKDIVSYIVKFLSSVLFFVVIFVGILCIVLSEDNIKSIMNKNDYASELSSIIREEMENYTASANIPYSTLDDIYTSDELASDLSSVLSSFYKETQPIETDEIKLRLDENIKAYLESQNIKSIREEDISRFVDKIAEIYLDEVNFYGYTDFIKPYTRKVKEYMPILLGILVIIELVLVLVIRFVFHEKKMLYILFTSSILLILSAIFLYSKISIDDIILFQSAFSLLLQTLIKRFITYLVLLGVVLLFIGMLFGIDYSKFKKKTVTK